MVDDACNEILQIDISDNVKPDIIIDDTIDHKIKEDVVSLYNNCYKNALIPSSPETDYEMRITLKSPYVVQKILPNDRYLIKDIEGFQVTRIPFEGIFDPSRLKHWMHNNCESASDSEGENHSVEVEDNLSSGSAEL
ncbi:hypothetical protein PPYR_11817 [Photinus pyralis]|uniref:Uncharacterized protein n=1 Tax=Photinus pyralis TaxID=7054 RepID=A0A5N4ACK0_PHOPY|nr:hypothetical protein PPYR_11817 [Photinus pyralis]